VQVTVARFVYVKCTEIVEVYLQAMRKGDLARRGGLPRRSR
jgi:hypothetical protein